LTISDHLFDNTIVDRLTESADSDFLNVAVDRKLDSIFDLEDAMKVQTRGNRVTGIGKHLREFDAIDTGSLVCSLEIFDISSERSPVAAGTRPLKRGASIIHATAYNYDRRSRVTISPRALPALITANALRNRLMPATVTQR
jgi:choline kinase